MNELMQAIEERVVLEFPYDGWLRLVESCPLWKDSDHMMMAGGVRVAGVVGI